MQKVQEEYDILRRLRHSNVVAVHGIDVACDCAYIITEWMPGGSLSDMMKKMNSPLHEHNALSGLAFLHCKIGFVEQLATLVQNRSNCRKVANDILLALQNEENLRRVRRRIKDTLRKYFGLSARPVRRDVRRASGRTRAGRAREGRTRRERSAWEKASVSAAACAARVAARTCCPQSDHSCGGLASARCGAKNSSVEVGGGSVRARLCMGRSL
eukprot:PhF_6_TR40380/c1_g7_i5/m.60143